MRRLAALLVLGLLAASCGDDGGSSGREGGSGSLAELLASVPDDDVTRAFVGLDDHAAARDLAGVTPPDDAEDADGVAEYLTGISGIEPEDPAADVVGFFDGDAVSTAIGWANELGIGVGDIDRTVVAGELPETVRVAAGSFAIDAVAEAVAGDPEWSGDVTEESHAGAAYLDWGEGQDLERITAARPLGRGGQLAVTEDRVIRTFERPTLETALEAEAGERPSLADDEGFVAVAAAMDAAGAYSAVLTDRTWSRPVADPLTGVEVIGLGAAAEDDAPQMLVALYARDEETAAANAGHLEAIIDEESSLVVQQPWSSLVEVVELGSEGRLTVARLDVDSSRRFRDIVFTRDNLLAHE